uniref:Uncharacterized protein n=1 Tax=Arundo donax TaxID=35708 RepID=A0A0A9DQU6_ARUDO
MMNINMSTQCMKNSMAQRLLGRNCKSLLFYDRRRPNPVRVLFILLQINPYLKKHCSVPFYPQINLIPPQRVMHLLKTIHH